MRLVSSAYMRTVDTKLEFGKSFKYNRKSKGPKMDPCGMPHVTILASEKILLIRIL